MIGSQLGFALEDSLVKYSAENLPMGLVIIMLGAFGTLGFGASLIRHGISPTDPVIYEPAFIARTFGEFSGAAGFITTIWLIPLASASAILQATPLAVTAGAALFFGETVRWRRWSAIAVGFVGVLMVIQPGGSDFQPASLMGIVAVFGLALRDLATKKVSPQTHSALISFYGFAAIIPVGIVLLLIQGGAVMPSPMQFLFVLGAAAMGMSGYYAIVTATRIADASVVTPFRYFRLIFALIIGISIFGEKPNALMLWGVVVILGSGLYLMFRGQKAT